MDNFTAILLALITFAIGFALAVLLTGERSQPEPQQPAATAGAPLSNEILRLLRDPETGHLLIELAGERLGDRQALNPDQQARLARAAGDLQEWLEPGQRQTSRAAAPVEFAAVPTSAENAPAPQINPPPRRTSLNPIKVFTRALIRASRPVEPEPASIVVQINEILQRKLLAEPGSGRSIRLVELPGAGMAIYIGLEKYDSIEAIPQAGIRDLIRQAASEWEAKVNPE